MSITHDDQRKNPREDKSKDLSSTSTVHEVHVREDVWRKSAAQEFKERPRIPELHKVARSV